VGARLKTPSQLVEHGVKEHLPSRRIWRGHWAYRDNNGFLPKPAYLATMFTLEASGALPQIGDPAASADRITQEVLAAMMGLRRETLTKRLSRIAAPEHCPKCGMSKIAIAGVDKLRCVECGHEFDRLWNQEKRDLQSRNMKAIAAKHPHWNKGTPPEDGGGAGPEMATGQEQAPANTQQRPVRCIITRNAAFAAPNCYALAMPETARPELKAHADRTHDAAILAAHFGEDVYDREAEVNGWRDAWGWNFDKDTPDAPDCVCRRQKSFEFQQTCPTCKGRGFTIGGSMSDSGRVILHWLNDHGIDEEIRRCAGCQKSFSHKQAKHYPKCPQCGVEAPISKQRGILEGYTQKEIAEANGMHPSTVRRQFTVFRRLGLVRTVYGTVWRKCCCKDPRCKLCPRKRKGRSLYQGDACPHCKTKAGAIDHRDPWKILWLPCRTFDRDLAKAEKQRLEASLRWHRRWIEHAQQESLKAAVELSIKVLGEWSGHEHQISAFYHEMRRRLNTSEHARFINVLFPLNTS
jgi:hypothetical protein